MSRITLGQREQRLRASQGAHGPCSSPCRTYRRVVPMMGNTPAQTQTVEGRPEPERVSLEGPEHIRLSLRVDAMVPGYRPPARGGNRSQVVGQLVPPRPKQHGCMCESSSASRTSCLNTGSRFQAGRGVNVRVTHSARKVEVFWDVRQQLPHPVVSHSKCVSLSPYVWGREVWGVTYRLAYTELRNKREGHMMAHIAALAPGVHTQVVGIEVAACKAAPHHGAPCLLACITMPC